MVKNILISTFLFYLRWGGKIQLAKIRPKIVALTGSMGKTSLCNAVVAILATKYKVKKSVKANSETGIPLDLLDLHPASYSVTEWIKLAFLVPLQLLLNWQKYDIYVVELGVDDPLPPKNMEYLLGFIKPNLSIFLNVGLVHAEQFEKILPQEQICQQGKQQLLLEAIAKEKGKIVTTLSGTKVAVVNRDDPYVWQQAQKSHARIVSFGKSQESDLKIIEMQPQFKNNQHLRPHDLATVFKFAYKGKTYQLKLPVLVPEYYAWTFAAAQLAGIELGMTLDEVGRALEKNFTLPEGRMSVFTGIKESLLIDSSYNASKVPTLGILELLTKIPKKPKIVVLGDMRELGSVAGQEHQEVGKKILSVADEVVLIGPLTKKHVLPIISGKKPVNWFAHSFQAGKYLRTHLKRGALVLIKGSQNNIFTEVVVEALLVNKKDKKFLCRREQFWQKKRDLLREEEVNLSAYNRPAFKRKGD